MHAHDTAPNEKLPRSFASLNAAQFLGAMNDNTLKLLIIFFLINDRGSAKAGIITAAVGTAFVLPFLLFSAPAGCLADRLRQDHRPGPAPGGETVRLQLRRGIEGGGLLLEAG